MAIEEDNAVSMDQWDPSNIFEDCLHENDENDKKRATYGRRLRNRNDE